MKSTKRMILSFMGGQRRGGFGRAVKQTNAFFIYWAEVDGISGGDELGCGAFVSKARTNPPTSLHGTLRKQKTKSSF